MKTFEWQGYSDGYGVVGVGYYCPHCNHENMFIDDELEEKSCEECKEISMPEGECFEW